MFFQNMCLSRESFNIQSQRQKLVATFVVEPLLHLDHQNYTTIKTKLILSGYCVISFKILR